METTSPTVSRAAFWSGHAMSAAAYLMMLFSVSMKLLQPPGVPEHFAELGWPQDFVARLAVVELLCTVLYLVPRTALLGAILLTAYLGGAAATHARLGDGVTAFPIVLGVFLWGGLWLRSPRLRALVPLESA